MNNRRRGLVKLAHASVDLAMSTATWIIGSLSFGPATEGLELKPERYHQAAFRDAWADLRPVKRIRPQGRK